MNFSSAKQNDFFSASFCEVVSACAPVIISVILSIAAAMLIFVCLIEGLVLIIGILSALILLVVILKGTRILSGSIKKIIQS